MNKNTQTPMNTLPASIRSHHFKPFLLGYTEAEAQAEADRCLQCHNPKCKTGCPIQNRIPEFMKAVKEGHYEEAYQLIRINSCMPAICGTVCPHEDQCEGHCIRNKMGEPVKIGAVERFVGEWAMSHLQPVKPEPVNHTAAVIGSGPAGLAFAQTLAEHGWSVTIYERKSYIGGVLAWGIPSYRLDRAVLEGQIKGLQQLGVQFILNSDIKDIQSLQAQYEEVFIATGATAPHRMNIEHDDAEGVFLAEDFLERVNLSPMNEAGIRHFDACGKRVMVVGGGNVAMDAARDAIRLPQTESVTIVYRRTEAEMPAAKEELAHAKEEGIQFMALHNPVSLVIDEKGHVCGANLAIMELGDPDESGRRSPHDSGKPPILLPVDTVIFALGSGNEAIIASNTKGLEIDKRNRYIVHDDNQTTVDHIYAGGDAVTGAWTVVSAMKAGINAAKAILNK